MVRECIEILWEAAPLPPPPPLRSTYDNYISIDSGLPDPPRNLTKTDCYPVYISWNSPQSMGEVTTPVLFYFVKIMSSRGDIRNYTVNNTFIWLTAEEMNPNLSYTISVSAVNCRGMSPPVEIIMSKNDNNMYKQL